MKSGNLNFLELSEPLQVGNGTALPLPLHSLFICDLIFERKAYFFLGQVKNWITHIDIIKEKVNEYIINAYEHFTYQ